MHNSYDTEGGLKRSGSNRSSKSSKSSGERGPQPAMIVVADSNDDQNVYDVANVHGQPPVQQAQPVAKDSKAKTKQPKSSQPSKPFLTVNRNEDRDPKHITVPLKVDFDDIIGETNHNIYTFDASWNASKVVYNCCLTWWYRIMTLICGVPIACCWGCCFACLSCSASWCWAPQLKAFQFVVGYMRIFFETLLSCLVEPCCFAYGKYWSRIRVVIRHEGKDEHLVV